MAPLASHDAHQSLVAIHASLTSPFLRQPYDPPLGLLRACDPALRQACITHLIWLYSHWLPILPAHLGEHVVQEMTESAARRGMRVLRCVMARLESEDDWAAMINPWQAHLLRAFERLAPFPEGTSTQGEVCDAVWGPAWPTTLGIRPNARHFPVYELARMSQELGFSVREIRDELMQAQTDGNGWYLGTVKKVCAEFRDIGERVLGVAGRPVAGQGRERPPMVALRRWEDSSAVTYHGAGQDFTPSGRPAVDERLYERKEETLVRFGEDVDEDMKEETPSPTRSPVPARSAPPPPPPRPASPIRTVPASSVLTPPAPLPARPAPVPVRPTVPVRPARPPTPSSVPTPRTAAQKDIKPIIPPDPPIHDVIDLSDMRTPPPHPSTPPRTYPIPRSRLPTRRSKAQTPLPATEQEPPADRDPGPVRRRVGCGGADAV